MQTLIAWELGAGLGHVYPIVALGGQLKRLGHKVIVATRNSDADVVLSATEIETLKAPIGEIDPAPFAYPSCLAEILLNVGFADSDELSTRVALWCDIFRREQPDVIVCDHSPTAQLAARCCEIKVVRIGVGFCCPPSDDPETRDLRPWRHVPRADVVAAEERVRLNTNRVRDHFHVPPLRRFDDLQTAVDETYLMTFRELDHFPHRRNPTYWGPAPLPKASPPSWPVADGPKVLAYLKPFPALPAVLEHLRVLRYPTLVLGDQIPETVKSSFNGSTISFPSMLVDVGHAARDCDLTITNASHAVTAASLLAGKPVVMIPIVLEQAILAKRIVESGVGIWAYPHKPADIVSAIHSVIHNPVYRRRAEEFATRYRSLDAQESITRIAASIDQLARSNR
jgi:UDP:flavonoid glycosyltransferase YjiC (YdhE family)